MNRDGLVAQVAAWSVLLVLAGCDDGGGPVGSPPTFTELTTGLTGVEFCSLAWGDADNDGDLDLAVAGYTGSAWSTKVHENRNGQLDGAWELATDLAGVNNCSLAWGDADNDGDLDLAVAGYTGGGRITKVYENRGGQLDAAWELAAGLTGFANCSLAWGDADNDGDLDLAVTGNVGPFDRVTKVYENDGPLPNAPPQAPTGRTRPPASRSSAGSKRPTTRHLPKGCPTTCGSASPRRTRPSSRPWPRPTGAGRFRRSARSPGTRPTPGRPSRLWPPETTSSAFRPSTRRSRAGRGRSRAFSRRSSVIASASSPALPSAP
jgi:hypothetical protein